MIPPFGKIVAGFFLFIFLGVGCASLPRKSSDPLPAEPMAATASPRLSAPGTQIDAGVHGKTSSKGTPAEIPPVMDETSMMKLPSTERIPPKHDEAEKKPVVEVKTGMIFAKTAFEGVVKASYVRLSIVDQTDHQRTYQLVIGDEARQQNFPWEIQKVQSGYFFIELPVGFYRIQSISIPVGTTVATEPMDIAFHVRPNKAIYIGTLNVVGTKEKIKIGGMPVIKPGFEYTVDLIDERDQAIRELYQRFPKKADKIEVHLMQINQRSNTDSPK
jgi:hypothetical protein